ncbi:receptor kinase-like protein Xa21 [Phragmites australis]|uniref:receptor kinase-like protein Xa21 n=1 Tax=Phragmites australis TaxID=29695 RepID=UPI002D7A0DEE|nr:receptor kinase-like protein Xa21 [Phragmites australis]XP_062219652.1 receptor kinase-like protein Xa21 [Phragmites australis]
MEVAVKVFNLEMQGAERSFMSECEVLRSIQHRNLLPIITACSSINNNGDDFKALVYEYMPNGNLDTWLHPNGEGKALNKRLGLTQRISIAVNIADALDYLHHDCGRPTVHCDLKPSNILLDVYMTALLGDFGIARFYADSSSTSTCSISIIGLKGTIGYIPPEYAGGGHASTSGDVYSFGIVLLEMLTGKRPTHPMFKDGLDIVNFVESSFPEQMLQVIDPHLIDEYNDFSQQKMVTENVFTQCVASLLQVALSCTHALPTERMNMRQIATKMHAIKTSCLVRKSKSLFERASTLKFFEVRFFSSKSLWY